MASAAGAVSLSAALDRHPAGASRGLLFVPRPDIAAALSGTFREAVAGVFYMRGILALTDDVGSREERVGWVQRNFDCATSLDPRLIQGYFFGGIVAARDRAGIGKGIAFLKKGLERSPGDWQIPYWIGMDYYQIGEFLQAARYYDQASRFPDAPPFLRGIQPMAYYRAGRPEMGIIFLKGLVQSVKDPRQLELIEKKLSWLNIIVVLEKNVQAFVSAHGRVPADLQELAKAGMIAAVPDDPFGQGFYLDPATGRVKSRF